MELMTQDQHQKRRQKVTETAETSNTARFMGKVFLYMLLGLVITAVVAVGLALLLTYVMVPAMGEEDAAMGYLVVLIVSTVGVLITSIWAQFGVFRHKTKLIYLPFVLYSIFIGALFSSFLFVISIYDILIALGITIVCFSAMGLVGYFSKASMKPFVLVVISVGIGLILLSIINVVLFITNITAWTYIDAIVTYGFFALVMLITMIDMHNIRRIAENGEQSRNLILYCAFTLYVDFIWILIRVLAIMARSRN